MASAAGGSGRGQDHHRLSCEKWKTPVGPEEYKPSKYWMRTQLRHLEATNEKYIIATDVPPFNIESVRFRDSLVAQPNPPTASPPSSSTTGKKSD